MCEAANLSHNFSFHNNRKTTYSKVKVKVYFILKFYGHKEIPV